ncbi:outer membrane OprD family porin [Azomonas agilis]|uniref:Outer membrane OprD family porin n=1 Tax=Azomonas agilis TaxID=116849 RepID=A0A562J3R4_9GAMM|nr:OprD family porin [Azomonas agilis]TWH77495.1 outer membrane OprD family porin [Azomonas agilis]
MKKSLLAPAVGAALGVFGGVPVYADFIEDSKLTFSTRNFYYNQDVRNQEGARLEEWGQGFMLNFQSGFTEGPVGFGVDALAMYGLRLDSGGKVGKAGVDRTGGSVFPLESNGSTVNEFSKVGVTGKVRFAKTVAQLGALRPRVPVVIANDGRLLPQMYWGAQIVSNDIDKFTFTAGKLEHSTERNSSDSDSLSIEGSNNRKTGQFSNEFYYGGVDFKATKDLTLQYYYGKLRDFYEQHFLGLVHNWQLPVGKLQTDLRYFSSDSDGKNSSASGRAEGYRANGYWSTGSSNRYEVDNQLWSALFTYSLQGHSLGAGVQKITGNSDFPHLNQGGGRVLYLITDAQVHKFHNAGENTWVVKYAYDFAAAGIPGLKAGVNYFSGDDIDAAGSDKREWERDIRLDYTFQEGVLKGVGLSWMNAMWRGNDTRDVDENRLIVNYSIPLL